MREIKFRIYEMSEGENPHVHKVYLIWRNNRFETEEDRVNCKCLKSVRKIVQFTGLKDKNGKEIYEGDILSNEFAAFREGEPAKFSEDGVEYDDTDLLEVRLDIPSGVSMFHYGKVLVNYRDKDSIYFYKGMEVIGNIYENRELLKEESAKAV